MCVCVWVRDTRDICCDELRNILYNEKRIKQIDFHSE